MTNAARETPTPFCFSAAVEIEAAASPVAGVAPGPRKVSGTAYSGDVVDHPYAGRVVFDLASTSAPEKMPLLVEHDRAQRAGVAKLAINPDNITIGDGHLLPNAAGNAVANDADAGFPWQLSVHIQPAQVDTLNAGEKTTVNGRTIEGPLSIFRNSLIREVSFTPTGVDSNTSAAVFSVRAPAPATAKETPMSDPTNTPNAEAIAAAVAAALAPVQASLDAATASIATLTAERDALRTASETAAREARLSAVQSLFSDTGREFSDAAAAPYLAMPGEVFSAVAADLRASKAAAPNLPAHLFAHTATNGKTPAPVNDPHKFSAAITERVNAEAAKGRTISVVEAAQLIRAEQSAAA